MHHELDLYYRQTKSHHAYPCFLYEIIKWMDAIVWIAIDSKETNVCELILSNSRV